MFEKKWYALFGNEGFIGNAENYLRENFKIIGGDIVINSEEEKLKFLKGLDEIILELTSFKERVRNNEGNDYGIR
jgi:hypothetical protein